MKRRAALLASAALVGLFACSGGDDRAGFVGGTAGAFNAGGSTDGSGGEGGPSTGARPSGGGLGGGGIPGGGGGSGGPVGGGSNSGGAGGGVPGGGAGSGGEVGSGASPNGGGGPGGSGGVGGNGAGGDGAGGAGGGANGGAGGAEPLCTLSTPMAGCDNCVRIQCNSQCRSCELDDGCKSILECIKADCFVDGNVQPQCAQECIGSFQEGTAAFQQLISPTGCVLSSCGAFCNFF